MTLILSFLLSVGVSFFSTYHIILFSKKLGWGDMPNETRKIHNVKIPNLGGIAVFIATMVSYFVFCDYQDTIRPDRLFSISIFLFFVGLGDDMKGISARSRLIIEFFCVFLIIYITDIRIITFWNLFGINTLNIVNSYIVTSIFMVGCINAYNMIDGIDGLLTLISLLGAACFSVIFTISHEWLWTLMCVSIAGALIGFLYFNWNPAKIFMGNGGSLFLGTLFACLSVRLMQLESVQNSFFHITAPLTVVFSIISIPTIDIVATIAIRLWKGYPPLAPDKCHIHHRLLLLGLTQKQTCLSIITLNLIFIILAYFLQPLGALRSLFMLLLICVLIECTSVYFSMIKKNKKIIIKV